MASFNLLWRPIHEACLSSSIKLLIVLLVFLNLLQNFVVALVDLLQILATISNIQCGYYCISLFISHLVLYQEFACLHVPGSPSISSSSCFEFFSIIWAYYFSIEFWGFIFNVDSTVSVSLFIIWYFIKNLPAACAW